MSDHAAKRRQEEKLRKFATMYGANPEALVIYDGVIATQADYSATEARILAQMSMSKDRVRFVIDTFADDATRTAFLRAFGISLGPKTGPCPTLTVVCRPSQFARFLIYRNDLGGRNSFKELHPVLFTPESPKPEIDVSGNPAQ